MASTSGAASLLLQLVDLSLSKGAVSEAQFHNMWEQSATKVACGLMAFSGVTEMALK